MKKLKMLFISFVFVLLISCTVKQERITSEASDEITCRLDLVVDRITRGELPRIDRDFLLAGLTLDPQFDRRFTNYSGDQEGRYLSAMTLIDPDRHSLDIHDLVRSFIACQKTDGRFGADTLSFDAEDISGPQMALLWGNGRLLTGLMDYYEKYPERREALISAQKLGDFLDRVTYACTRPEIIGRFKTMGALGFICFTQITEGMVKLYQATGSEKYRQVAENICPLLPEPGSQHSHGYLITLRGLVMLYEATGDTVHLARAEQSFSELIAGENYLITGGVPEFFSFHASAEGIRDEGCSETDFFLLSLQLWEATGKGRYLDQAEYTFMNHLLYNQFKTGDFGHHVIKKDFGFVTSPVPAQSWWCCNYHGLQALHEAGEVVVTRNDNLRKINLFYPSAWEDEELSFTVDKLKGTIPSFQIKIISVSGESARLAIRNPSWSSSTGVTMNGEKVKTFDKDGYLVIDILLKRGDKINFTLQPVLKLVDQGFKEILLSGLSA